MSAAVQDVLDVIVEDHRPSRVDTREAIRKAVHAAASERRGLVHIAAVRRHLPPWAARAQIGCTLNRLTKRGYLVDTGRYEPNGDTHARNGSKPAAVRRLVRLIPPEALR